jgi:hypothetical protein
VERREEQQPEQQKQRPHLELKYRKDMNTNNITILQNTAMCHSTSRDSDNTASTNFLPRDRMWRPQSWAVGEDSMNCRDGDLLDASWT